MSFTTSKKLMLNTLAVMPAWLHQLLGADDISEGATFDVGGQAFVIHNGIPRSKKLISQAQAQTSDTFGFKLQGLNLHSIISANNFFRLII